MSKKLGMRKENIKILITVAALFLGGTVVYAASTLTYRAINITSGIGGQAFYLPIGATATIDSDYIVGGTASDCRVVTNNGGPQQLFIPTNSVTEWRSFVNNPPAFVNLAACTACTQYTWGSTLSVCGDSDNSFPWPNNVTGSCDASTIGWYKVLTNVGSSCRGPGLGVTYTYQVCGVDNSSCTVPPACKIEIYAGGIGGSTSNFNIGWGYSVQNSASSVGNCSFSGTTQYGSNSTHFLNSFFGPYTAAPGNSAGAGPSMWIDAMSWSGAPLSNFDVSATVTSVSCPSGTTAYPSSGPGWTVTNTLRQGAGTKMYEGSSRILIQCF